MKACRNRVVALWLACQPFLLAAQFATPVPLAPAGLRDARVADLDGDGTADVLAVRQDSLVWCANTDGTGTFGPLRMIVNVPPGAFRHAVADVDGDGDLDIVAAQDADSSVYWMSNQDGLGAFGNPQLIGHLPSLPGPGDLLALCIADLNGDGLPDVALTHRAFPSFAWWPNTGGAFGALRTEPALFPGMASRSLVAADMDGDGDMDLLLQAADHQVFAAVNMDGIGTLWNGVPLFQATGTGTPCVIDIDADGADDIGLVSANGACWARNTSGGGVPWPSYGTNPISGVPPFSQGSFAVLGCGPEAAMLVWPPGTGIPAIWFHFDPTLDDFTPALPVPGLLTCQDALLADVNNDGRPDLLVLEPDDAEWRANTLPADPSTLQLTLPALDTLCRFGGVYPLPAASPTGGFWSGPNVASDVFAAFVSDAGLYPMTHVVSDADGCPVAGRRSLRVIESPWILGADAVADRCPSGDVLFTALPAYGHWYGLVDSTGLLHTAQRPLIGDVIFEYIDPTGASCFAELGPVEVWDLATPLIFTDTSYCTNEGPRPIGVAGPSPGLVDLVGPVYDLAYLQPNLLSALFDPAQGPGTFDLVAHANAGGRCPDSTLVTITVWPAPQPQILAFDTLCSGSGPYPLTQGLPAGGAWSGPGVSNDAFTALPGQQGPSLLTYSYTDTVGCTAQVQAPLTVILRPTIASSPTTFCADDSPYTFIGIPGGGQWTAPLDPVTGLLDPASVGTYPLTADIQYTHTDATGASCTSLRRSISVRARTDVQILSSGPWCADQLNVEALGNVDGQWGGAASGSGFVCVIDPATLGVGSHWITLAGAAPGECPGLDSALVSILALPAAWLQLPVDTVWNTDAPFALGGGIPAGGVYMVGDSVVTVFDPAAWGIGPVVVTYLYTEGPCKVFVSDTVVVQEWVGMAERGALTLRVGPNPTNGPLHLLGEGHAPVHVRLVDATGRVVMDRSSLSLPALLDLSDLAKGSYTLHLVGSPTPAGTRITLIR